MWFVGRHHPKDRSIFSHTPGQDRTASLQDLEIQAAIGIKGIAPFLHDALSKMLCSTSTGRSKLVLLLLLFGERFPEESSASHDGWVLSDDLRWTSSLRRCDKGMSSSIELLGLLCRVNLVALFEDDGLPGGR